MDVNTLEWVFNVLVLIALGAFLLVALLMITFCVKRVAKEKERAERLAELARMEDGSIIAPDDLASEIDIAPEFWLSGENVLHNSLCRWYEKCDGTVWNGESEYKNCGLCGGDVPIVRLWNIPEWKLMHKEGVEEDR